MSANWRGPRSLNKHFLSCLRPKCLSLHYGIVRFSGLKINGWVCGEEKALKVLPTSRLSRFFSWGSEVICRDTADKRLIYNPMILIIFIFYNFLTHSFGDISHIGSRPLVRHIGWIYMHLQISIVVKNSSHKSHEL